MKSYYTRDKTVLVSARAVEGIALAKWVNRSPLHAFGIQSQLLKRPFFRMGFFRT